MSNRSVMPETGLTPNSHLQGHRGCQVYTESNEALWDLIFESLSPARTS